MSAAGRVLDRVREYRVAARKIVRADRVSVERRLLGLLELADAARVEPDLTIRTWAERSIWEESKAFLGMDDEELPLPPEGFERRQRRLRLQGEETCSRCLSRISTEDELRRWSRARTAAAERRDAREGAIT